MNLEEFITPHFKYKEVIFSKKAQELRIDNSVPEEILPKIILVAKNILEPVRNYYNLPVKVSSWWRSPLLNSYISLKSSSQHTKGEAVDFIVKGVPNLEVANWIKANLNFDQLIREKYDDNQPFYGWLHCSYINKQENRNECLRSPDAVSYFAGLK